MNEIIAFTLGLIVASVFHTFLTLQWKKLVDLAHAERDKLFTKSVPTPVVPPKP